MGKAARQSMYNLYMKQGLTDKAKAIYGQADSVDLSAEYEEVKAEEEKGENPSLDDVSSMKKSEILELLSKTEKEYDASMNKAELIKIYEAS